VLKALCANHTGTVQPYTWEYEALRSQALAKMREIGEQMREKFSIVD